MEKKTRFDDHHPFHYKRYWEAFVTVESGLLHKVNGF